MGCYFSKETLPQSESFISEDLNNKINQKLQNTKFQSSSLSENQSQKILEKSEILSQYKFYNFLGKGMFCEVRLAKDKSGRKVAIKMIRKRHFTDLDSIKKIIIEKEIMNSLSHRNILKLFRTFQTNSRLFFVLEYAENGNLLALINSKPFFTMDEIRIIVAQIVKALLYMHKLEIIYGDLKAENVLFDKNGVLKLCDFNLSGTRELLEKTIQGTTSYLSPEIIQEKPKTPKSDFWSLGILIHLMFYKRHAFTGARQEDILTSIVEDEVKPEQANRKAVPELRALILDLLVKNPIRRIGNNVDEFKSHSFFRDFSWSEDLVLPLNSFPRGIEADKTAGNEVNATMNNFVYEIADFTFDSSKEATTKEQ